MTLTTTKPKNYLNNRDILSEIHKSKTSYCAFTNSEDHRYDFIVDMPTESIEKSFEYIFKPETIQTAKETRAARLSNETSSVVTADSIAITDLVFRVSTWDHIPVAPKQPKKSAKKKTAQDIIEFTDDIEDDLFAELEDVAPIEIDDMIHVKVNFSPFQHFKIDSNNSVYCVGKSHWVGDLQTGEFSKEHGTITNKLARMYIMLAEKYSQKWNWRGYTYVDEMRNSAILQLTYVGLRFNEAKSNNPFAYYTAAITNSFCRVLNTEKRVRDIRDDLLELNNLNPSYTRSNSITASFEE